MSKIKKPHPTDKELVSMVVEVSKDFNDRLYDHQLKLKIIGVELSRPELAANLMEIGLMEANRVLNKKLES